jgi:glycine/D-amino acid oxidase-like deaminating enzyme
MKRHIIIIGSGILGSSIAWHAAKAGARVTVIEAGERGGIATAGSWAWINASWGNALPYFRLRERAMLDWRRIDRDVPGLEVDWCGGLLWDLPEDKLKAYAAEHASWGYGIRQVGREEILRLEPNLKSPPDFALYVAEEGKIEPLETARALLAGAEALGADVLANTRVKWLSETNGRVDGVALDEGTLYADDVIIAAGVGATELLRSIGIQISVNNPLGLLVHSIPLGEVLNGLVMAPEFHVKQDKRGSLVAGSDFSGGFDENDVEGEAHRLFNKVTASISGAEPAQLKFHTITERPTPADGLPMIGRLSGTDGVYLVITHSGITLAPAIGQFVAEEVLHGTRDALLEPFAPERLVKRG